MTVSSPILTLSTLLEHHTTPADVGAYSYGVTHAMKPQRMRITHELVSAYDMLPRMHILVRPPATRAHSDKGQSTEARASSVPNALPRRP